MRFPFLRCSALVKNIYTREVFEKCPVMLDPIVPEAEDLRFGIMSPFDELFRGRSRLVWHFLVSHVSRTHAGIIVHLQPGLCAGDVPCRSQKSLVMAHACFPRIMDVLVSATCDLTFTCRDLILLLPQPCPRLSPGCRDVM
jgi:hypothetical protein